MVGTVSYMSPEQACGHPIDFRSDQFSFGAILYEMATGKRAFEKANAPDTLSAILHEEPPPMAQAAARAPAPLGWVAERCLAKDPADRYASTRDLASDLANVRDRLSHASGSVLPIEAPRRGRRLGAAGLAATLLAVVATSLWLGGRIERAQYQPPRFRQLTFRGAGIGSARFVPDGQTIVFSAQTEGKPPELFSMRLDGPEVRSLGLPPAQILSISRSGEMAILLLKPSGLLPWVGHIADQAAIRDYGLFEGTLAEASLAGGAPRELLENVTFADWTADGKSLAVVHRVGNRHRLEFPVGKAIYEEQIGLGYVRTSPRDDRLALNDWGSLFLKETNGTIRQIPAPVFVFEIAWSGRSGEIWYGFRDAAEIRAIAPGGSDRLVGRLGADFVLYDIAADGRVLLGRLEESTEILGSFPGETRERNLSYFNESQAVDLSRTGETLLFLDATRLGATALYIRKTDGSAPRRLAEEAGSGALSPDERLVLLEKDEDNHVLIPTGPGQPQTVNTQGVKILLVESLRSGFFPDGRRVFFTGFEKGYGWRIWVQDLEGGKPRAITPENTNRPVLVGDGRFLCARGPDFEWHLYPVDERGEPRKVVGILPGEEPLRSTPDGLLYVRGADELRSGEALMTTRVYRLDPWSGRRELIKEIPPLNPRTGGAISTILLSADGKTCVWEHHRYSTELVLAEGLR